MGLTPPPETVYPAGRDATRHITPTLFIFQTVFTTTVTVTLTSVFSIYLLFYTDFLKILLNNSIFILFCLLPNMSTNNALNMVIFILSESSIEVLFFILVQLYI